MPTFTRSELEALVLDRVEGNSLFFTVPEIDRAITDFIRVVNAFTGLLQDTVPVPGFSVANQLLYTVPAPILFPMQILYEGRQLQKVSLGSLARNYRRWAYSNTLKDGPVQRWAPIGITTFAIYPVDEVGGHDISVVGVIEPTPLATAGSVIQLEDEYVTMLVEYCGLRLQLKEGGKTFSDASIWLQAFYRQLKSRMVAPSMKFPRYFILSSTGSQG